MCSQMLRNSRRKDLWTNTLASARAQPDQIDRSGKPFPLPDSRIALHVLRTRSPSGQQASQVERANYSVAVGVEAVTSLNRTPRRQ